MEKIYIFKDQDGYFIGKEGTSIVKKITRDEFLKLQPYYAEWKVKEKEYKKWLNEVI